MTVAVPAGPPMTQMASRTDRELSLDTRIRRRAGKGPSKLNPLVHQCNSTDLRQRHALGDRNTTHHIYGVDQKRTPRNSNVPNVQWPGNGPVFIYSHFYHLLPPSPSRAQESGKMTLPQTLDHLPLPPPCPTSLRS